MCEYYTLSSYVKLGFVSSISLVWSTVVLILDFTVCY